jgi:hypothetical protein
MTPTRFGRSHIENVKIVAKTTNIIVFLGNQLSDYVKMFVPSGPETGKKLHQTYCFLRKAAQPSTGLTLTVNICSTRSAPILFSISRALRICNLF